MFQIISLIAVFQALFFGILVITKKNKSMLDKHVSAWLLFLTIHILCISASQSEIIPYSSSFLYPSYILAGLHGFFLYLCTKSLMSNSPKDFRKEYISIAGYIAIAVIGFIFYNSYPQTITVITRILAFLCNALFIILAVRLFHRYKKFLQTHFSNIDKLSFNWMRFLAFGLIILLSGALVLVLLSEIFSFPVSLYSVFAIIVLLFVNVLGFRGIKHSTIFNQTIIPYNQGQPEKQPATNKEETSYANYGLKQEDAIILSERLKTYMEDEKPYTNMDLTLKDLASALDTYPHYITQVLNTLFNQNFYEFINTYRVEEVQRRLHDSQFMNLTILAIAYDCGFNSKSAFNRIFKQKTGLTPSEYKKQ